MGTRICAYWSQQYRCLYPGSIAEPGSPDPHLDGKFVCVEFDDGDSGTIAIEDIRLLPPDYPIMGIYFLIISDIAESVNINIARFSIDIGTMVYFCFQNMIQILF